MLRNLIYLSSYFWRGRTVILKTNSKADRASQVTLMHSQCWEPYSLLLADVSPSTEVWWAGRMVRWTHLAGVGKAKLRKERDRPRKSTKAKLIECDFHMRVQGTFQWSQDSTLSSTFYSGWKCFLVIQHVANHLHCQFFCIVFSCSSTHIFLLPQTHFKFSPIWEREWPD